ncbi:MAG: serine/threonine protein phosphatase [Ruminococcaceae bacterium]|nr:serine/threonine protein phosphatase [Oscillospiraceae bacterium]
MALYAISDLHLSFGTDKPMNIFGAKWENYTEKLKYNWQSKVCSDDVVIIPGDISWALYIEEAYEDFKFLNSLSGTKVIMKGNHDYWWTTVSKMEKFFAENNFNSIKILNNNAYMYNKTAVCGTRGWNFPTPNATGEDKKIFEREKIRLVLSLENAKEKSPDEIIVAMHYPPLSEENYEFIDIMKEYGVSRCVYGHLHGPSHATAYEGIKENIEINLISCDYMNFDPLFLKK